MSLDLAVWEGSQPANDAAARAAFSNLAERFLDQGHSAASTKIAAYVRALTARYPELVDDGESG